MKVAETGTTTQKKNGWKAATTQARRPPNTATARWHPAGSRTRLQHTPEEAQGPGKRRRRAHQDPTSHVARSQVHHGPRSQLLHRCGNAGWSHAHGPPRGVHQQGRGQAPRGHGGAVGVADGEGSGGDGGGKKGLGAKYNHAGTPTSTARDAKPLQPVPKHGAGGRVGLGETGEAGQGKGHVRWWTHDSTTYTLMGGEGWGGRCPGWGWARQ